MPHFQTSLAEIGLLPGKATRRAEFFERLDRLVPWDRWVAIVEPPPPLPEGAGRRPVATTETMLRMLVVQRCLFAVLRGIQDGVVLSGEVQIDEKMHPLAAKDRVGGRAGMGAYSKDRICIAVGCDDSGRSLMVRAGLGKLSKSRCWDAYGGHIERGSTLVHDMENAHSVLVDRLGLKSVAHRSSDLRGLDDRHSPLSRVNHMHFLLKEFMHRHSGFDRGRTDDWLNLFSVIVNPLRIVTFAGCPNVEKLAA